jgi:hypothetical protein
MASVFKVGLVYIIYEVLSKYIYLLTPTCIITVVNFTSKSKYQLSYLWRNELLE